MLFNAPPPHLPTHTYRISWAITLNSNDENTLFPLPQYLCQSTESIFPSHGRVIWEIWSRRNNSFSFIISWYKKREGGMMCGALADIRPRPRKPPSPPFPLFLSSITFNHLLLLTKYQISTFCSQCPLADCPAMSFVFVCWQINIRNTNQLSWTIN